MELFFLRHGIAAPGDAAMRDFDRPLTVEGVRKTRQVVRGMKVLELAYDLVLSSPFLRARQTAAIVARAFSMTSAMKTLPELAADTTPARLILALMRLDLPERVLLVGHEPLLSGTLSLLLAGQPNLSITIKKAGLVKLTIRRLKTTGCATLEWLLTPRQLGRLR